MNFDDQAGKKRGLLRLVALPTALALSAFAGAAAAQSVPVGAGTSINNDATDSAGGRINVDQNVPRTLQPGTYVATLFNFDAGVAGDVTPFLAVRPNAANTNAYVAIAVGTPQAIAAPGQNLSLPFGGSATFTLAATTQVFAGIASSTQNPIPLANGAASTDHEGGGQAATSYFVTLGGNVPPDGAFSNPDLGRAYAFSIDVQLVPEPSLAAVTLIGAGVAQTLRRPRRPRF